VRLAHLYSDAFGAGNINMFLHNLIRLDGVWEITNKTATHLSRAAGLEGSPYVNGLSNVDLLRDGSSMSLVDAGS
jgi:hypothetical protein